MFCVMKSKTSSISPDLRLKDSAEKNVGKAFIFFILPVCSVLLRMVCSVKHPRKVIFLGKPDRIAPLEHSNVPLNYLFPFISSSGFTSGWDFLRFGSPGPPGPKEASRGFPGLKIALSVADSVQQGYLRQKIIVDGFFANFWPPVPFSTTQTANSNDHLIRSASIENLGKPFNPKSY